MPHVLRNGTREKQTHPTNSIPFIGRNTAEATEKTSMSSSSNDIDACFAPGGVDTDEPKLEHGPKRRR